MVLDFFPENVLIDILSYLNVRELVRNSRVCRRWKQLVKDQRLWRAVDLSTWKGVRVLLCVYLFNTFKLKCYFIFNS